MDAAYASNFDRMPATPISAEREDTAHAGPTAQPTDGRAFRSVLGKFATGVTVVTCASATGPVGMTVNSFTSLSLDPPLVMWSPAKSSGRYGAFNAADRFAVHVLHAHQKPLANAFMRVADAFSDTDWTLSHDGLPLIDGCLARFTCERVAEHDAGDHIIMVGRVTAMQASEGDPLLYFAGKYGELAGAQ